MDQYHVLIRLPDEASFRTTYLKRDWWIKGKRMRVFRWTPTFSTSKEPTLTPDNADRQLASTDVRICVEIDLTKPACNSVLIQSHHALIKQTVTLLSHTIPAFCPHCTMLGHTASTLPHKELRTEPRNNERPPTTLVKGTTPPQHTTISPPRSMEPANLPPIISTEMPPPPPLNSPRSGQQTRTLQTSLCQLNTEASSISTTPTQESNRPLTNTSNPRTPPFQLTPPSTHTVASWSPQHTKISKPSSSRLIASAPCARIHNVKHTAHRKSAAQQTSSPNPSPLHLRSSTPTVQRMPTVETGTHHEPGLEHLLVDQPACDKDYLINLNIQTPPIIDLDAPENNQLVTLPLEIQHTSTLLPALNEIPYREWLHTQPEPSELHEYQERLR